MIVQHAGPAEAGISQSHSQPTLSLEQNRINNLHFNPFWTGAVAANQLLTLMVCVGLCRILWHAWLMRMVLVHIFAVYVHVFLSRMCTHKASEQPDGMWINKAHPRPLSFLLCNVISVHKLPRNTKDPQNTWSYTTCWTGHEWMQLLCVWKGGVALVEADMKPMTKKHILETEKCNEC